MMILRYNLIFFLLLLSCNQKKNSDLNQDKLLCAKAKVTEILGYNSFFGGGEDIIVKCLVEYKNFEFNSQLTIDVSLISEAYCPFKVGDIVVAKFLKDNKKIVELYLLERYNHQKNYTMDMYYTLDDICNNGKEFKHKGNFIKGKI